MSAALSINKVEIAYDKAPVIHGIDFEIHEGETFGLIGLNGAGKTTLIKAILGLREVDRGGIQVFGEKSSAAQGRRRYAYLPERFDPPWFLSGIEFLRFSLSLYQVPFNDAQVRAAAAQLALDPAALDRRVQTYSKGMRQKLGLLGTVLTGCSLLILDEPMSGLDPLARAAVKDMLLETKGAGRTIFLSSHILSDMDEICDRVGVLHLGQMLYLGSPAGLREKTGEDHLERAFLKLIAPTTDRFSAV